MNPLRKLQALGQSVWLDDIRRSILEDGTLATLIEVDGVSGVTSNPTIFAQAIGDTRDYQTALDTLLRAGADPVTAYRRLVLDDVARAADLLAPVHAASGGRDGYVSLEVSPHLAHDACATVAEARLLWQRLARPNVMIKVPATAAGLEAIRRLAHAGVNVNVTLLFGVQRYAEVADAWMTGLESRLDRGEPIAAVASVASFFLSRIDSYVDRRLDARATTAARALRGQAAIACARLAYRHYRERVAGARWRALAAHGVQPQRLLWASTSTKNPAYSDVLYVDNLIGPDTVNTLPPATLRAYRDHGRPTARLATGLRRARQVLRDLAELGIDMDAVGAELERDGITQFLQPYDRLLSVIEARRSAVLA